VNITVIHLCFSCSYFSVIYSYLELAFLFCYVLVIFICYIYMCVCVCIYICVCVYVYICVCVYIYVCVCMCIYVCVCIYICVCMYIYVCVCVCMYIYVCVCISGGLLSALTCCVNVRLLSAIKKILPLIYSQSWVGSWVYTKY